MNSNSAGENPAKPDKQQALNAFLVAAEALDRQGEMVEAEIRYKEALSLCEREFGEHSDQTILTLSILAAFYRAKGRSADASMMEARIGSWDTDTARPARHALAGEGSLGAKFTQHKQKNAGAAPAVKSLPSNIRRACQILGIAPDSELTFDAVNRAWKAQMLQKNAHPDLGGNAEEALLLNKAKTEISEYLDFIAPKKSSLSIKKPQK